LPGAVPSIRCSGRLDSARRTQLLCDDILCNRSHSAKRKNAFGGWNVSEAAKVPGFIALERIPVQK
jgi:hypothetical protein